MLIVVMEDSESLDSDDRSPQLDAYNALMMRMEM